MATDVYVLIERAQQRDRDREAERLADTTDHEPAWRAELAVTFPNLWPLIASNRDTRVHARTTTATFTIQGERFTLERVGTADHPTWSVQPGNLFPRALSFIEDDPMTPICIEDRLLLVIGSIIFLPHAQMIDMTGFGQ